MIASVHAECEPTPLAARCFLIRRFFRLYPLHFATLLAALFLDFYGGTARLPGYGAMVLMNLTMTHAWGVVPGSVLNGPSWSISTEWAAYLLFAWICLVIPHWRRRIQLLGAIGLVSLATLIVLRGASLDGDLILRVPRCLMSFALGAVVWSWCRGARALAPGRACGLQLAVGAAMLGLLVVAGERPHLTLLMPLLSAAMIVAMVRDPGSAARRVLERPVPQWLGRTSYSLYLVHMPLFGCLLVATGGWRAHPVAANLWVAPRWVRCLPSRRCLTRSSRNPAAPLAGASPIGITGARNRPMWRPPGRPTLCRPAISTHSRNRSGLVTVT